MRLPEGGVGLPGEAGIVRSLVRDRNDKIHQVINKQHVLLLGTLSYKGVVG